MTFIGRKVLLRQPPAANSLPLERDYGRGNRQFDAKPMDLSNTQGLMSPGLL